MEKEPGLEIGPNDDVILLQDDGEYDQDIDQEDEKKKKVKKRKPKKHRKKHPIISFLIFIVLVVSFVVIMRSSLFSVVNVRVEGNVRYTNAEVVKMSGISRGDRLFRMSVRKAEEAAAKNPYFESVDVTRKLPDTIVITVVEKQAVLAVPAEGGYAVIDASGTVLEVRANSGKCIPVSGITLEKYDPGKKAEATDQLLLEDACRMIAAADDEDLFFTNVTMTPEKCSLYIHEDLRFEGTPDQVISALDTIKSTLYKLNEQGITRGVLTISDKGILSYNPVTT